MKKVLPLLLLLAHPMLVSMTSLVRMPELPTNIAVLEKTNDDSVYDATIYSFDGTILSEFHGCVSITDQTGVHFECAQGDETLSYFEAGIYLISWQTPVQMEIFQSEEPTGRFEQCTGYSMELYKTEAETLAVNIDFQGEFGDPYPSCEGQWVENAERDVEIYCANPDETDVLIFGVKKDDKLVLTAMWNTPKLADDRTYFQGEIMLNQIADLLK